MPATTLRPLPHPASPPSVAVPARDGFIDLVRLVAMGLVVLQHWLMPVLTLEDGVLRTGNAWAGEWVWPVTWLSQVMPLVFFAGGAAAAMSLRRRAGGGTAWAARRLHRLAAPVLVLAAVWLPLTAVLTAAGLPAQPVHTGARYVGALLWFLALYSVVTVVAPLLVRLAARARGAEVGLLAATAVAVDVVRFHGGMAEELAYVNVLTVWVAVHQVGVHYAAGRLWWLRGTWALATAVGGFTVVAFAVALGPYPPSMVGLPGAPVSNMGPPTAVLLALAAGQIALVLALRPAALAWAGRADVTRVTDRLSGAVMTAYLWHTPALVLVAGVALLGLGRGTPEPFSGAWYAGLPLWLGALTGVLVGAVRLFGRAERWAPPRSVPGPTRLAVATLLVAGGMLGLTLIGFAPAPPLGAAGPWVAGLTVAAGLGVLAGPPPTIDRWSSPRPSTDPTPSGLSTASAEARPAARTGA